MEKIPFGEVRSYGDLAIEIGRPQAYRAVGSACNRNPWPVVVPCHRVVAASSMGGYGGGLAVKRFLLELEGFTWPEE
jgi:O-6-methylguanine DNA methyltransferase